MKIIVCIKQVPGTTAVEVDEKSGVLKRDGVESKMNPYDLYAIEQALLLKEQYGGTVDVISMGPGQARAVLKEAIYMGADRAFLVSDRRFGGADVVATSYTLSQGIEKAGNYDLIICGKQTTDGDTAQVGPEMAEFMGIKHIANVLNVLEKREDSLLIRENQENNTGHQNDDQTRLIAFNEITAGNQCRQNEADKEKGVQTHATSLGKGHLCIQRHQQRADDSN